MSNAKLSSMPLTTTKTKIKVAGVKVYPRQNQNNRAHAVSDASACDIMGQCMQCVHALACDVTGQCMGLLHGI
jgi:hypothetical protein